MISSDVVNGLYELAAGYFLFQNCRKLYRDKEVKGWSIISQAFFTSWSYWNLWYYPHLNQWMSFVGGLFVVLTNTSWTILAIHYTQRNKKKQLLHG